MSPFHLILRQSIKQSFRKGGGAAGCIAFYVIIITLFTFALGPHDIAVHITAICCVGLLLANITLIPLFFSRDHEDGTLEQLLLSPVMLEWLVLAKLIGYWVSCMVPLLLISPLLLLMADINSDEFIGILIPLICASPAIVALGSITSALTLGLLHGGLLQALLVMPLYIPVLIFAALSHQNGATQLLLALSCMSVPAACFISSSLIKLSQD